MATFITFGPAMVCAQAHIQCERFLFSVLLTDLDEPLRHRPPIGLLDRAMGLPVSHRPSSCMHKAVSMCGIAQKNS
jgi:hypothetical protein